MRIIRKYWRGIEKFEKKSFLSGGPPVAAGSPVSFIGDEIENFLFVRIVFGDTGKRSEEIRGQIVRHTVMYCQIDQIFGCFEGFYVSMTHPEFFFSVDYDKSFAYLNYDILIF